MDNLFRSEVFESKKIEMYGSVFINKPSRYEIIVAGYSLLLLLIVLFVIFAEFSEQFIVPGFLNSSEPFIRVYSKANGIISRAYRRQGDLVKKGDPLFLIDTSYTEGEIDQQNIALRLARRRTAIEQEILHKKKLLHSLKELLEKKYVSVTEYSHMKDEITELENKKILIEIDDIRLRQRQSYAIRSPINGVISNILYQQGQHINITKPLVKIIPVNSKLIAELFIPARHAGYLHQDSQVIIRYDAYPYVQFGAYQAKVKEISQSIMMADEEDKPIKIGEPYYKAMAALNRQSVTLYGKEEAIKHGMTLTAVVAGPKRKVWQWIFDPVYNYYGAIFK